MRKDATDEDDLWITNKWVLAKVPQTDQGIEIMVAGGRAFMRHTARPDQIIHMGTNEFGWLDTAFQSGYFEAPDPNEKVIEG